MVKFKTATALLAGLLAAQLGYGQTQTAVFPAIYEDGTLHIFRGAVVNDGSVTYYKNIRLDLNADGNFSFTDAEEQVLAEIHTAAALVTPSSDQVEVVIEGWLSSACKELDMPAVIRPAAHQSEFHIVLAETRTDTNQVCAQVVESFTVTVELDIDTLSAGNYVAIVNGEVEAVFSLNEAQALSVGGADVDKDPVFRAPRSVVVEPERD